MDFLNRLPILILTLVLLLVGCANNTTPHIIFSGEINGIIVDNDSNKKPLVEAEVSIDTQKIKTNDIGSFTFKGVNFDQSSSIVKVEWDGQVKSIPIVISQAAKDAKVLSLGIIYFKVLPPVPSPIPSPSIIPEPTRSEGPYPPFPITKI